MDRLIGIARLKDLKSRVGEEVHHIVANEGLILNDENGFSRRRGSLSHLVFGLCKRAHACKRGLNEKFDAGRLEAEPGRAFEIRSQRALDHTRWQPLSAYASARFGVPEAWIERVIRVESVGQVVWRGRPTTSPAGAMGLMQLMPRTWAAMRRRLALGDNAHDPRDNILAGTLYLRLMYDRFGYPGLFGAYNAGPGRYAASLSGARGLPPETSNYLVAPAQPARAGQVSSDRSDGSADGPAVGYG